MVVENITYTSPHHVNLYSIRLQQACCLPLLASLSAHFNALSGVSVFGGVCSIQCITALLDMTITNILHPRVFDNRERCKDFQAKFKNGSSRSSPRKSYVSKSRKKKSKMFDCDQSIQEVKNEATSESSLMQDQSERENVDNNDYTVKYEAPLVTSLLNETKNEKNNDQNAEFITVPKTNEKILKKSTASFWTQQQQNVHTTKDCSWDPDWFTSKLNSAWSNIGTSDGFGWISSQSPVGRPDNVVGGGLHRNAAFNHRNNIFHPHFKVNNFII